MKTLLLVSATADFGFSGWVDKSAQGFKHQKAFIVPLHLATIAALTPADWQVRIWDEIVDGPAEQALDQHWDLMGLTAYSDQLDRALAVAAAFRARGITVVMGGAGVTAEPDTVRGQVDHLFLGEAETTWPQFLADLAEGRPQAEYVPEAFPDLSLSPPPRWDSIADAMAGNYKTGAVQTNRGCPHRCEFCHVWIKYGRRIRTKPVAQVLDEIAAQQRLGMKRVMFCTDNFVGDPRYAKEVLRALIPLNNSFRHPLRFNTELTLTIAGDEEMLRLLAEAGFNTLFIGIESTSVDSLKEARKGHNLRGDLVEQCLNIAAWGLPIIGSLIAGFDTDRPDIFDHQFAFLQEARIPIPRLNLLKAGKGTDLHDRVRAEGRVVDMARAFPRPALTDPMMRSNIVPRSMSRRDMYAGYLGLLERVWDWRNFHARMVGFLDAATRLPERRPDERLEAVAEGLRRTMLDLPGTDRDCVEDIFRHAHDRAPALAWEVASMTMMQCYEAGQMPAMRRALEEHIDQEERLEQAGGAPLLPAA